ncbi:GspH/FimT family pseudopilin [Jeongeupia chitinilytica]|uniref:Type II secretion system protein H n=1 Tax=Jeongeupia chitinilytica TaxID=1041641 RepID=A0ABQ3H2I4_9NEIS|nr:GspH/FimT family pseudopilin [Jeongeupia chitinilytica]GHD64563.1 prepilin-type N-terminal cleavage/methylation domain-containing protein [Jeongeupia chitinilytica]
MMHKHIHPKRQTGSSLLEVMVSISILGILAAVAVPSMVDWVKDVRLASQSDMLVSALNTARLEAIKRRSNMTVCPKPTGTSATSCSTSVTDWSSGWLVNDTSSKVLEFLVQRGITVSTGGSATSVVFNPTLGSAQSAATFTLCISGHKQHQVAVALSGRVSKTVTTTVCS